MMVRGVIFRKAFTKLVSLCNGCTVHCWHFGFASFDGPGSDRSMPVPRRLEKAFLQGNFATYAFLLSEKLSNKVYIWCCWSSVLTLN